jgi:F-type H+-transporting ATPase subunit b
MELITKLGIDWKLLLAQIVNFLIVLGVLYRFLYRPLVKHLADRKERIDRSLQEAQRITDELKAIQGKKAEAELEAKRQAQEIVDEAIKEAGGRRQEILDKVKEEAAEAVAGARRQLEAERETALADVRREAAKLVTLAVTRVIGKLKPSDIDKELVAEVVDELAKRRN